MYPGVVVSFDTAPSELGRLRTFAHTERGGHSEDKRNATCFQPSLTGKLAH